MTSMFEGSYTGLKVSDDGSPCNLQGYARDSGVTPLRLYLHSTLRSSPTSTARVVEKITEDEEDLPNMDFQPRGMPRRGASITVDDEHNVAHDVPISRACPSVADEPSSIISRAVPTAEDVPNSIITQVVTTVKDEHSSVIMQDEPVSRANPTLEGELSSILMQDVHFNVSYTALQDEPYSIITQDVLHPISRANSIVEDESSLISTQASPTSRANSTVEDDSNSIITQVVPASSTYHTVQDEPSPIATQHAPTGSRAHPILLNEDINDHTDHLDVFSSSWTGAPTVIFLFRVPSP